MFGKMFAGLGNALGGQPQFTPPIMPQGQGQQMPQPAPQSFQRKGLFGGKYNNTLGSIGAALRDAGDMGLGRNNNHLGRFQAQQKDEQSQALQQSRVAQMLGGAGGGQGGYSPAMQAAAQMNPQAFAKALADRQLGVHQVTGGNSIYNPNTGGFSQAPQNFQNGSRIATMGPNGMQSYDMGQNQAEANTQYGNQTTRQNNLATQDLRGEELAETIRNNDMVDNRGVFANDTGRMNAVTNREKAQFAQANPTSDLGKNPLYMTDENGQIQVGQLGNGQIVKAQTPDGMTLLSPYEKSMQQQQGRSEGKTLGETSANLPAIENNAQRALKTVDQLLNHKGIDAGTGKSAIIPAIPGTDKYAFNVANKQAQGQVFLQGFEALKGGGVITEVEGLKAEQALARMDKAQSREDYEAGLKDYRDVIANGMAAAYQKAGMEVPEQYRGGTQSQGLSQEEMTELEQLRRELGQ